MSIANLKSEQKAWNANNNLQNISNREQELRRIYREVMNIPADRKICCEEVRRGVKYVFWQGEKADLFQDAVQNTHAKLTVSERVVPLLHWPSYFRRFATLTAMELRRKVGVIKGRIADYEFIDDVANENSVGQAIVMIDRIPKEKQLEFRHQIAVNIANFPNAKPGQLSAKIVLAAFFELAYNERPCAPRHIAPLIGLDANDLNVRKKISANLNRGLEKLAKTLGHLLYEI